MKVRVTEAECNDAISACIELKNFAVNSAINSTLLCVIFGSLLFCVAKDWENALLDAAVCGVGVMTIYQAFRTYMLARAIIKRLLKDLESHDE